MLVFKRLSTYVYEWVQISFHGLISVLVESCSAPYYCSSLSHLLPCYRPLSCTPALSSINLAISAKDTKLQFLTIGGVSGRHLWLYHDVLLECSIPGEIGCRLSANTKWMPTKSDVTFGNKKHGNATSAFYVVLPILSGVILSEEERFWCA